jgi:two-component system phosphate regulon sensor histidine kinase PhoR
LKERRLYRRLFRANLLAGVSCVGGAMLVAGLFLQGGAGAGLALGAGLAAGVAAGAFAAWRLADHYADPVESLHRGAHQLLLGEPGRKLHVPSLEGFDDLATTLNTMVAGVDARLADLSSVNREHQAILESMQEGVLALDRSERIVSMNQAAERMLGVGREQARGKLLQEAIRHAELQRFLKRSTALNGAVREDPPLLEGVDGQILQAKSTPLADAAGNVMGTVVLLENVTRVRRLENLAREFVGNVSHELRTPITSIKGFSETLLDGALDDPEEARYFVEIIQNQADRLGEIIEDLLKLSRLDRAEEIDREPARLRPLMESALEAVAHRVRELHATVELECPEALQAPVNRRLLEQALVNLLDNALKYGGAIPRIGLAARLEGSEAVLEVSDEGPGIPEEHLPRLFERFYRIDKARSREKGGTGLGLSIVKHVALAHRGDVVVESTVGGGTTFRVRIPGASA